MVRSHLTTKFMMGVVNKEAKAFIKSYNSENEDKFKSNYTLYITLGVIDRKGLPDVDDVLTLIKLGNSGIDDTQAELKLQNALESEEYKERGLVGIFCDLCKDLLCIDLVLCDEVAQTVVGLEDSILDKQRARQKMRDELNNFNKQIKDALNSIKSLGQKEQTEEKEEQTKEKEEQTQE